MSASPGVAPWPAVEPTVEGARSLVRWAATQPRRVRWSPGRLQEAFCARGPRALLAEAEISFTAPCCDLSSITAYALDGSALRPTLVLTGIRRALSHVKFQCGLEVQVEGKTWVVGFGNSSVYFYEGRFVETPRRPLVLRVTPPRIDPERPFLAYFDPAGREGVHAVIPGYCLDVDLRWHTRRQGWLRHAWARWRAESEARARRGGRLEGVTSRWS